MAVSLREQLLSLGINGHEAQRYINEYRDLCALKGTEGMTIGLFIQTIKDSMK